jgi:hypothetical protein
MKKEFSKTLKILMNSKKDLMLNKNSLTVYLLNVKGVHHKENMLYKKESSEKPGLSFYKYTPLRVR